MTKKAIIAGVVCSLLLLGSCGKQEQPSSRQIDTIPTMVMQIQKCSRLYTTEYKVHKIITHDDNLRLKGSILNKDYDIKLPVGSRKIAIPMDATIKAYIDFSGFSKANVRRQGRKIVIILPDPRIMVTSTRIQHKEVRKYVALLRSDFSDAELSGYERQGRKAIVDDIPSMGITETARESAARVIIPIIRQMGYDESDITISFRKDFTRGDYNSLIDKSTIEHGKEE